ncbi:hypothetical protein ASC96_18705 [Rhizobium sp. Root1204]|nr:hypothetical protein ASC96_18705 [Rhizobium sp. Root1204]
MHNDKISAGLLFRLGLLIAVIAVPTLISPDFLSLGNIAAIGQSFAVIAPVALAIGLTMIAGELDLSVGAMVAISGLVLVHAGADSTLLGIAAALVFGAVIGIINAYLTLRLKVSSLVTTLGVMIVLQGAAVWLEGGQTASFDNFDLTDILGMTLLLVLSPWSLVALALGCATWFILGYSRLGRDIYAAGSDRKAALMSGANVKPALYAVFIASGVFAALDGVLMAISLGRASSQFGGPLLIQSVTSAILGGVALSGGVGKVTGIFLGALILSVLSNGLSFVGASSSTVLLINGGVLLAVVLIENDVTEQFFKLFGERSKPKNQ